jgi:PAS domain S-box-containing protein
MMQQRERPLILNVDDNDVGRYTVTRELRRMGYDVLDAGNGGDALELAGSAKPDLVVLDIHLPDIDGFEVCRRLKTDPRTASILVLHLSASYLDDVSRLKGFDSGADGYLTEPLDPAVLSATVKALLRMKEAERAERIAAQRWQATFDAIADGVAIVDSDGTILSTNRALSAITGRTPADLIGISWYVLFPAEPAECVLRTMFESGKREVLEHAYGDQVLRISCDPIRGDLGAITGCVAIASDITDWHKLQEALRHTQKLESIGLLAGGIAHDFNNLLTGIQGNANLALDGAPPSINGYLRNVVQASERAADLARQLLAYAGKGPFVVCAIDVQDLVRDLIPLVQAGIPRKAEIVLDFDPDVPPVEADAAQLRQVLMNLVINGAEAIGETAGTLRVRIRSRHLDAAEITRHYYSDENVESGRFVVIQVSDTGCGMDDATRLKVFDPFFSTKFLGRGLGLAAALGIVRQHRGGIRVESAPGRGTTFEVVIPATEAKVIPPPPDAAPIESAKSGTVLVVDDEEIVRDYTEAVLRKFGYQVILAANGAEGVEVFRRSQDEISIVLLDLTMPVMGGEEALSHMLRIRPETKVVIVSGFDETDVIRRVGNSRIAGFLQKPFSAVRLAQRIREVLKESFEPRPSGSDLHLNV